MLNHILMMVMQLMLRQSQHQAMRNSIGFSPSSVVCSISITEQEAVCQFFPCGEKWSGKETTVQQQQSSP